MKTRYMSYDELDEQRRELQDSVGKLSSEMEKVTKKFAEAVESRVPVDLIETQLLRLDLPRHQPSLVICLSSWQKTRHGLRFSLSCLRRLCRNSCRKLRLLIVGLIMVKVRCMKIIVVRSILLQKVMLQIK